MSGSVGSSWTGPAPVVSAYDDLWKTKDSMKVGTDTASPVLSCEREAAELPLGSSPRQSSRSVTDLGMGIAASPLHTRNS